MWLVVGAWGGSLMATWAVFHDQPTARITIPGTTLRVMPHQVHPKHLMENAAQLTLALIR